jgi:type IV pilus assembly protein PilA
MGMADLRNELVPIHCQGEDPKPMFSLRTRLQKDEDGFTLIELMVVVLIIAILIAIAIPTFMGVQDRAKDTAAKSNLRNALANAEAIYTDTQSYGTTATLAPLLEDAMPELQPFVSGATLSTAPDIIHVEVDATGDIMTLTAKSESDTCFQLVADKATGVTGPAPTAAANCG